MSKYLDPSYQTIFLKAGDICVSSIRVLVWTILGSCVSVVLNSKSKCTYAICHGQLPDQRMPACSCTASCPRPCGIAPTESDDMYVSNSIHHMIDMLKSEELPPTDLEARIYGGSAILHPDTPYEESIGYQNIATSTRLLNQYGIPITEQDTGGYKGRSIYLYADTGEIKVKNHNSHVRE